MLSQSTLLLHSSRAFLSLRNKLYSFLFDLYNLAFYIGVNRSDELHYLGKIAFHCIGLVLLDIAMYHFTSSRHSCDEPSLFGFKIIWVFPSILPSLLIKMDVIQHLLSVFKSRQRVPSIIDFRARCFRLSNSI